MSDNFIDERFRRDEPGWLGQDLRVFPTVGSTNHVLRKRLKEENVPPGATIIAMEQSQGRGRLGRSWWSPPGQGLYVSTLLYPPKLQHAGILSLLAAVALTDAVRRITGLTAGIKWPNDGIIQGKKYAGILVEAGTSPISWAIVGIGINVTGQVPGEIAHAITLEQAGAKKLTLELLWQALAHDLEARYESWLVEGNAGIIEAWRAYSVTLGQIVLAQGPFGQFTGTAEDVDEEGRLLIRHGSSLIPVSSGEVSVRAPDGSYAPSSGAG
ncbi:biotin--[acetyl-CoA-carboxylase] ligase [Sulfobacillus thermosulfidooxidans]|uniref:biotin--[acetyl-CoA-carboxylase] ligase n=1 Tax=Sulfobacillus thermosulfidooxidans TaxID=28034 RepID=UPI0002F908EA|nr:biotin--[acetyl-CoA-carboxylase] ligase [Sulfobacillus thermosulfidooxidans]